MTIKKPAMIHTILICLLIIGFTAVSQSTSTQPGTTSETGDVAQQNLVDITLSQFEDAAYWSASMPIDQGFITARRVPGEPKEKEIRDEERIKKDAAIGLPKGGYVLGVKVIFNKRGMNYFFIKPIQPIAIEGIVKTISVWVIGRNYNHVLKIMLSDYFGEPKELVLGKLNFSGWKKLTVAIPPQIKQSDYHYTYKNGLRVLGFKVECDLYESQGQYFIYFDDLSAVTDLFLETKLDEDDIVDQW